VRANSGALTLNCIAGPCDGGRETDAVLAGFIAGKPNVKKYSFEKGTKSTTKIAHKDDNDFIQPGTLYRQVMSHWSATSSGT
jgi:hypothetical protein